jgi:hypothetical protein
MGTNTDNSRKEWKIKKIILYLNKIKNEKFNILHYVSVGINYVL